MTCLLQLTLNWIANVNLVLFLKYWTIDWANLYFPYLLLDQIIKNKKNIRVPNQEKDLGVAILWWILYTSLEEYISHYSLRNTYWFWTGSYKTVNVFLIILNIVKNMQIYITFIINPVQWFSVNAFKIFNLVHLPKLISNG